MSHSHVCVPVHFTFSTRGRHHLITPELELRLWPYMAATARGQGIYTYAAGGVSDHAHLLVSLPRTMSVAETIQGIKRTTSRWINRTELLPERFSWQEGYGAFAVCPSRIRSTIDYIARQHEHHRTEGFMEEFIELLKAHGLPYDDPEIWL